MLVTELPASSTADTEFTASFAFVTWSSPICIVSIEPVAISLESTEFAAISAEPTAFAAIAAEFTAFAPTSVVVVTCPMLTSIFPVALGGASEKVSVVPLTLYVPFGW